MGLLNAESINLLAIGSLFFVWLILFPDFKMFLRRFGNVGTVAAVLLFVSLILGLNSKFLAIFLAFLILGFFMSPLFLSSAKRFRIFFGKNFRKIEFSKILKSLKKNPDLICAIDLFILTLALYYPGEMSHDSFVQMNEALTHTYSDWHPPFMAFIWHFIYPIIPGPLGMLILFNLIFWAAAFLFVRNVTQGSWKRCGLLILFGLYPPIFTQLGVIWKDTGTSVCLLMTASLLLQFEKNNNRAILAAVTCFLFSGLAFRHNAFTAVLPLCFWAGWILSKNIKNQRRRWVRAALLCFANFTVLIYFNDQLSKALVRDSVHLSQTVKIDDLTAISVKARQTLFPDYINKSPHFKFEKILSEYLGFGAIGYIYSNEIPMTHSTLELRDLNRAWLLAIISHPGFYIGHRIDNFLSLVAWGTPTVWYAWHRGISGGTLPQPYKTSALERAYFKAITAIPKQFLFRGWLYILAAGLLLFLSLGGLGLSNRITFMTASGLFYATGYLIYGIDSDFRYLYWAVMGITAAFIMALSELAPKMASFIREVTVEMNRAA